MILLTILTCTFFILGLGIILLRKDIEELKELICEIYEEIYDCKRESNKKIK